MAHLHRLTEVDILPLQDKYEPQIGHLSRWWVCHRSGVICEPFVAKSTKIDGVISRALDADQIQSCLAAVPPFASEDNYYTMKDTSTDFHRGQHLQADLE
ncbi:unnamed protein product [Leuciscus chuanchicus]